MDRKTTFWTTPSNTHCPYGNQTRESFQSIRFALDITSSQLQEPVWLSIHNISSSDRLSIKHQFKNTIQTCGRQKCTLCDPVCNNTQQNIRKEAILIGRSKNENITRTWPTCINKNAKIRRRKILDKKRFTKAHNSLAT